VMVASVPYIPDNAPFTTEQRAWLNGLLAGIFSTSSQTGPNPAKPSHRIAVLYASQSGTAEGLARKLAKELKSQGHVPAVSTLVGYTPAALAAEKYALILASTYGDGDAPDGVQPFYEQLCLEHFPRYEGLAYAVFALGDKHYEHFCKFGCDLDNKLAALGANPLCSRIECDVEVAEPFEQWKSVLLPRLSENTPVRAARASTPGTKIDLSKPSLKAVSVSAETGDLSFKSSSAPIPSRENPALARIVDKRNLSGNDSSKETLHLAFSIEGTGISYEAGDACGVIPNNDLDLVAEILQTLRFNGNEQIRCGKNGSTTLHDALAHHLQITRLTRKTVSEYAALGKCAHLLDLLAPDHRARFDAYTFDRGVIDLLIEFPGIIQDPAELVAMLPKLAPRLYSISSSPLAHTGQIHTTVAVVRYSSHNRERGGVCSTLFADRTAIADRLPIYIQPNKKFRLPQGDKPIIMIGPGTGIAPFRGFLHERRAVGAKGRNWLFFGERSAKTDYLYREELEAMCADGHLTRLDTAFSRDQQNKVYVQDRMIEHGTMFWNWLQDGASIYVCGDASRMAKDVNSALHSIVEKQGGMSSQAAEEYVQTMKDEYRYHRDVY
jgi:sulfite reductase (NADPH) flavoprotein alpha-component